MRQNRNRVRVLAVGIAFIFGACSQGDSQYTIVADQPGASANSASSANPGLEPDESRDLNADSNLSGAESEPTTEPPPTEPPSSTSTTAPPQTTTVALSTTAAPTSEPPTTSKPPTTARPTTEPSTTEPEPEERLSPFCQQAEIFQSVLAEIQSEAEAGVSLGQAERTEQLSVAVGIMVEISPVQHIAELAAMQATVADAVTVLEEDGWQPVTITSVFAELSQQFHLSDGPSSTGAITYDQSVARYWELNCTR